MIDVDRRRRLAEERDQLVAAQDRLLAGTPQCSNGILTIANLAVEAGLPRARLYEHHSDLIEAFRAHIGRGTAPPTWSHCKLNWTRRNTAFANSNRTKRT